VARGDGKVDCFSNHFSHLKWQRAGRRRITSGLLHGSVGSEIWSEHTAYMIDVGKKSISNMKAKVASEADKMEH